MKKFLLLICLNLIPPLLLLVIIPSLFIHVRQGTSQDQGGHLLSFISNNPVTYSFISDHSMLQSLSLDFKNPGLNNNSLITLNITGPTDQRTVVFYGSNLGDPSTVPLKFQPFIDRELSKYFVTLTTDSTDPYGLYLITNSDQQPVFKSYYLQPGFKSNLNINLNHQLDLFRQRNLLHNIFYIGSIIFIDFLILK